MAIAEVPERLDMGTVLATNQTPGTMWSDEIEHKVPACGTVGCIAGWANVLSLQCLPQGRCSEVEGWELTRDARGLLGLSEEQAARLFLEPGYPGYYDKFWKPAWPADLADEYVAAETPDQRARITVRRIDRFIETEGAE